MLGIGGFGLATAQEASEGKTQLIPIPVYATLPNEGDTYGLMPVWITVDGSARTRSIVAPSLTWNSTIGTTGTFRWYYYPTPTQTLLLTASASTHVNRSVFAQ